MRQKWMKLIKGSGLTLTGGIAISAALSIFINISNETSRQPSKLAQTQPANNAATYGDGNPVVQGSTISGSSLSTHVNKKVNNNHYGREVHTRNYTENNNRNSQITNCTGGQYKNSVCGYVGTMNNN